MAPKDQRQQDTRRVVNRKARHDYHIVDTVEVGIALTGNEVKSIRQGQVSLAEGFVRVEPATAELFLYQVDIAPYSHAPVTAVTDRRRPRKLLAHKREITRLQAQTIPRGTTIVPLEMYFVRGKVKLQIGLATSKDKADKRRTIQKRDGERQIQRGMTRKII